MQMFFPGFIMGFREGLEAFLIVMLILHYLKKTKNEGFQKHVFAGSAVGVASSLLIGALLFLLSNSIGKMEETAKLWESGSSFVALILVSTFIYWMIKHGRNMVSTVENKVKTNLSALGIFGISFFMVVREGAEVAVFTFAGKYALASILCGIMAAMILTVLIHFSLVQVNLKVLFSITLGYLILQAGFLLGYGIHEGLSALQSLNIISDGNLLLTKAFDLSKTVLNHKNGMIGLPLYALIGWYSKPEVIQFAMQYLYTFLFFYIWHKEDKKSK